MGKWRRRDGRQPPLLPPQARREDVAAPLVHGGAGVRRDGPDGAQQADAPLAWRSRSTGWHRGGSPARRYSSTTRSTPPPPCGPPSATDHAAWRQSSDGGGGSSLGHSMLLPDSPSTAGISEPDGSAAASILPFISLPGWLRGRAGAHTQHHVDGENLST
jgi:hypothetical protein